MIIKVFFIEEGFKNSVPGTQYSKYITELSSSSCNVKTYSKITTEVKNIYIYIPFYYEIVFILIQSKY